LNIHSNGFCRANHATAMASVRTPPKPASANRVRRRRNEIAASTANAATPSTVTIGDQRRIVYMVSSVRAVCDPNG